MNETTICKDLRDLSKIDLSNGREVKYWKKTLACTTFELSVAVICAGNSIESVKKYLKR